MKYWLAGLMAFVLAITGVFSIRISDEDSQLQQTRAQLATVNAKASGGHRDLITCADLQTMGLQTLLDINLSTDATGTITASPDEAPVPLPSHCINQ